MEGIISDSSIVKITRPQIRGSLERKRLFKELDLARGRPVVWISSPAGSGKTTLVSSYIDSRKLRNIWYQVDEGDADLATFFYYMSRAEKKANPRKNKDLPLLTPEYLAGVPTFARRYFEELFSRLNAPCLIVLDNYQEVPEDSALHDIIRNAVAVIPPGITILIISRVDPPPIMAPLKAAKAISMLDWEQLRLQRDELQDIVHLSVKHNVDIDEIDLLHRKTGGWAAGLVLLLEQGEPDQKLDSVPQETVPQDIFDYFAAEIFSRLDNRTKDFLMKSALFPVMTAEVVNKLTGFAKPSRIFSYLCKKNYFIVKRPTKEPEYEYHPLFREFLLRRIVDEFEDSEIRRLKHKAGIILDSFNKAEAAADLFIAAGEWDELARLIQEQSQSLVRQGRIGIIEEWLNALPREYFQGKPWLIYWQAVCLKYIEPDKARQFFARSFEVFKGQENSEGIFLSWAALVECFVLAWSDFSELDLWIEEIEELLRVYPKFSSAEIEAQVVSGFFCALMYRQPHHPDMFLWEERLRQIVFSSNDLSLKINISSHLIFYYTWWTGEQTKAMLLVKMLRSFVDESETDPLTSIIWKAIEAAYHWMTADNEACLAAVEKGLELADTTGIYLWNFMLSAQASFGTMTVGDVDTAGIYLRKMVFILNTNRKLDIAHYHYHLGWEALYLDQLTTAHENMARSITTSREAGVSLIHSFSLMGMAEIMIEQGKFEEAGHYLDEAHQMGLAMKSNTVEYQFQWLMALLHFKQGDSDLAEESLRRHLSVSREYGILNHACWRNSIMQFLYEKALEAQIEIDHVQLLIKRHHLIPTPPPVHLHSWPWIVKVQTLGAFSIIVDGEMLSFSGKAQKKPLELMQAIIALGGESVRDEQITDALWPDSDGDMAMQSYRTTISRLRKLLRHEEAIITGSGKVGLDRRFVWTDVWAFENEINKIASKEKDDRTQKGEKNLDRIFKILEQYPGEFLPECNMPWAMPIRERLRNRYLNAIMDIGGHLEASGETQWAINYYMKGLEVDNLVEALYQRLIACYGELGQGAEAVRIYDKCRKTLTVELGIEPSKKTSELLGRYVNVTD